MDDDEEDPGDSSDHEEEEDYASRDNRSQEDVLSDSAKSDDENARRWIYNLSTHQKEDCSNLFPRGSKSQEIMKENFSPIKTREILAQQKYHIKYFQ